jgi:hypothetical protein
MQILRPLKRENICCKPTSAFYIIGLVTKRLSTRKDRDIPMPKGRRVTEYIEWTTIPYRTIRFWIIVLVFLALGTGLYFLNKYGLSVGGKTEENQSEMLEKRAAQFVYIDGDVKVKAMDSIEWVSAEKIKKLYPGDLIKTSFNSSCRLVFFDGTVYEVKPNSLISILESYENRSTMGRIVNVELASGALDLSTAKKNVPQSKAKLETSNAVADVDEYTRASAQYDEKLRDSGIKVSEGKARITSKDTQQSIIARGNEEVRVREGELDKRILPPAPVLVAPMNAETFTAADPKKITIRLQWNAINPQYTYRVSISTHSQFYQKIHEDTVTRNYLSITGLPYGNYYWRVVAISETNIESYPSAVSMFAVRPMRVNPSASINFQIKEVVVIGNILEIIGKTDPDNLVTINEKMVIIDKDGSFKHFTDQFESRTAKLEIMVKDYSGAVKHITKTIQLD